MKTWLFSICCRYAEEVLRRLQLGKSDGLEACTEGSGGSETGDERWCVGDAAKAAAREGGRVAAFFALCLLLAPPAESLLLLDRSLWLHELGRAQFSLLLLLLLFFYFINMLPNHPSMCHTWLLVESFLEG